MTPQNEIFLTVALNKHASWEGAGKGWDIGSNLGYVAGALPGLYYGWKYSDKIREKLDKDEDLKNEDFGNMAVALGLIGLGGQTGGMLGSVLGGTAGGIVGGLQ